MRILAVTSLLRLQEDSLQKQWTAHFRTAHPPLLLTPPLTSINLNPLTTPANKIQIKIRKTKQAVLMGVDYYKILQVDSNAKGDDLRKAYRKLADQLSEAYDVLSDPHKRAIYNKYGEEGLKGQVPPPSAGGSSGGGRANPRSADDIFSEFFGSSSPFGGTGTSGGGVRPLSPRSTDDVFTDMFGSHFGGGRERSVNPPGPQKEKAAAIENRLPCSLEDLYKGTAKRMKISREIADMSGRTMLVEEILTIEIKPGWKTGTKITFPEKGNEAPHIIPADIVFIVDEKPHDVFTREGNDLIVTQKISLLEALTGYTVHLTMPDSRSLSVPVNSIIYPGYAEVVPMEGMPLQRDPSKKGNLRIKFNIKFPTRLTAERKTGLKKLLTP